MKKTSILFSFLLTAVLVSAQVKTPQPSPSSTIKQTVGLTEVSVEYSRPSVKGRTIFGDLVPYNKLWRTGANKNTIITFSDDVKIDGKLLKKGSYAIFTKPAKNNWEVIFYSDTNNWGTPREWKESNVAASVIVKTMPIPFNVETFAIDFNNLTNNGAHLEFIWEKTYVAVPIEVPTQEKAMKNIEMAMNGPSANDYFSSAVYYMQEGQNLKKASEWMDKAIDMRAKKDGNAPFWMLRQKSLIHAKMGDKKGAIKAAKRSLASAEKAGNADYIKMNKDSLKEWGAM